jgi:hypothetical protein
LCAANSHRMYELELYISLPTYIAGRSTAVGVFLRSMW